jgi:hypothetical protein
MKKPMIFLLVLCLSVSGCITWVKVGGPCDMRSENFTVELPDGWRRHAATNRVIITKEGIDLQTIMIFRTPIDKKLPFTQKKISTDMLPQEVAEVVIDDLKSNQSISNVMVVENDPAQLSGQQGFKITYTFQTKAGLNKKGVYYGLLTGNWLYSLVYMAPQRYYFDKDLHTFENIVPSFKIVDLHTGKIV